MKRVVTFLIIALVMGCETSSSVRISVNPGFESFHIRRVAILPFEGTSVEKTVQEYYGWGMGSFENNGEIISDMLTTEMMNIPTFEYLERSQIRRILQEHNLSLTQLVNDKTACEVGKLLGVDAVILGKVHDVHNEWDAWQKRCKVAFSARMVDTKTGTVLWSATVDRSEGYCDALKVAREECGKIVTELTMKLKRETPND
jgi:curli biogenesis system outer membrane secretion channel CsgG